MRTLTCWAWLLGLAACGGDKTEPTPDGDADTDTDADTDADTDTDTDADTDTDPEAGPCPTVEPTGTSRAVAAGEDLAAAIADADAGDTLLLADGTWAVTPPLVLDKPLVVRSASGDPASVVLDGGARGGDLVQIAADGVTLAHLTLANAGEDAISVDLATDTRADLRLWDLVITDPGRMAIVADGDFAGGHGLEGAELACVSASLSAAGRGRVGGECETGGVDATGARDVLVRDSRFSGFWCEDDPAMVGIRFWRGSRDITITRNVLADVGTGIVVGQTQDAIGRTWADEPCATTDVLQAVDTTVTNNVVFVAAADAVASNDALSVGILAESSCNATILHNSIYSGKEPALGAIRQRFATTTGIIANNLVSHDVLRIDGALADARANAENARFDTWYFPAQGDFHTAPAASWAIDQGDPTATVPDDMDGEPRDDGLPDIGADEQSP